MIKREIPAKQKSINSSDEIPQIKSRNTANIFVYLLNFCRWTQQLLPLLLLLCVTLIVLLRRYATVCQIRFIDILQSILPLKDIFLRSFFSLVLCSLEFLFGSFYKRSRSEYSGFFGFICFSNQHTYRKDCRVKAKKIASEEPMNVQYIENKRYTSECARVCNSSERKIAEFEWSYFLIFLIVKKHKSNAIKQT